jgi:hypothetical protein
MRRQDLTPEDFGIAVRKHPGALLITARSKMKNTEQVSGTISLTGRRLETTALLRDHAQNRSDLNWLVETVRIAGEYDPTSSKWHRWLSVDKDIISEFLKRYGQWAPHSDLIFSRDTLSNWVKSAKAIKFATWDVAVANGRSDAAIISLGQAPKYELRLPQRVLRDAGGLLHVSGRSRRLAGPTDLVGLLDPVARDKAEAEHKAKEPGKSPSEIIYYPYLERPALIVYPLGSKKPDDGKDPKDQRFVAIGPGEYLVALKVAIPGDTTNVWNGEGDITYVINTVAQQYWLSEFADVGDEDIDE